MKTVMNPAVMEYAIKLMKKAPIKGKDAGNAAHTIEMFEIILAEMTAPKEEPDVPPDE